MEALSGRLPAEDFAGTFVEHFLIGRELLVGDLGQVGAFGQVVADAAVLALAGAALPRAEGVAEEDLQVEVGGEGPMLGHFLALIIGQGLAQRQGNGGKAAGEGLAHALSVLLGQVAEHGEASGALHEHAHGGAVARAHNQIAFVMAGDQAVLDLGRPFIDEHHVGDLALGGGHAPAMGFTGAVAAPQALGQLALQFAAGHHVNVAVDRFVRGVHVRLLGVLKLERASDFLRRPASPELSMNGVAQRRGLVDRAKTPTHPAPAFMSCQMRGVGAVAKPAGIALQLGAQRAGRAPQTTRNRALRVPRPQTGLDIDPFGQTQNCALHRLGVSGRGGIGNRRNRTGTAEPVPVRLLRQRGTPCRDTTGCRCHSIHQGFAQIGHSNSSLSAPWQKRAAVVQPTLGKLLG